MKPTLPITALFLCLCVADLATAGGPEDSIVRVLASLRLPNPVRPWTKQAPVEVMGTGVVIDGKTVLTNAHIVLYAGEVFVQAPRWSTARWSAWSSGGPRTPGSSSPTRRSTPTSKTSRTAATRASPGSPTTSRRWSTRPCGRSSAWPDPTVGSWSASLASRTRPTRSARVTS